MGAGVPWLTGVPFEATGPGCEPLSDGFLHEPVSAISSVAFLVAAGVILVGARRGWLDRWAGRAVTGPSADDRPAPFLLGYATLVGGIGVGSFVQHGPNPVWADLAHDLPLLGTLVFIITDAVADLIDRPRSWWWWAAPTLALAPLLHFAPHAGDMAQGGVAVITVGISLVRACLRPGVRRTIFWSVVLLGTGGIVEIVSSPGWPLCRPGILWYGHAVWHTFIAAGLAVLAGAMGQRGRAVEAS